MRSESGLPGIQVERTDLGGFNVLRNDKILGWIHGGGNAWRGYLPADGSHGSHGTPIGDADSKLNAIRLVVKNSPTEW